MGPCYAVSDDEVFSRAVDAIVSQAQPAAIICYGIRSRYHSIWTCFPTAEKAIEVRAYDLLIIVNENSKDRDSAIQSLVNRLSTSDCSITAIVHPITAVRDAITNGSVFFRRVYAEGKKIYITNPVLLSVENLQEQANDRGDVPSLIKRITLSKKFLKGASHYLDAATPDLAVFMLHQAVEQALTAVIRVYLGYRPNTHNLRRLFAMTGNFAPSLANNFLREEDADLFDRLCAAYSEVRYAEEYFVSAEQALMLFMRTSQLVEHCRRIVAGDGVPIAESIVPPLAVK